VRDPREDCTDSPSGGSSGRSHLQPPNAFDRHFLEAFARRDPAPAVPEADNAGPWRVTKLHGEGTPRWACIACGERPPRFNLREPDVAHLVAAGLAIADRSPRFRFQVDAAGTLHLMHDGYPAGTAQKESETLPLHLTGLADLRTQPLALAHFLMAVPQEVLERAGALVMEMVSGEGR